MDRQQLALGWAPPQTEMAEWKRETEKNLKLELEKNIRADMQKEFQAKQLALEDGLASEDGLSKGPPDAAPESPHPLVGSQWIQMCFNISIHCKMGILIYSYMKVSIV